VTEDQVKADTAVPPATTPVSVDVPPAPPERRRNKPAPLRIVAVAVGVPVLLAVLFVVLYATGVIRDERRAGYCAVYSPLSADLGRFDQFATDLAGGDPATVYTSVAAVREQLDPLIAAPSSAVIQNRLTTMRAFLREADLAARRHDAAALAELNGRIESFVADRREFVRQSAEYCRYR
jgi:hypothetical protein